MARNKKQYLSIKTNTSPTANILDKDKEIISLFNAFGSKRLIAMYLGAHRIIKVTYILSDGSCFSLGYWDDELPWLDSEPWVD